MQFIFLILSFQLLSCNGTKFREDKIFAGGVVATKSTLNLGYTTYMEYCFACHGINGDGKGVAAKGTYPPVRNLQTGLYKFAKTYDGGLPHDQHLVEILKKGLNGTPMLPWDISQERALAVVQYIKTFAPEIWEGKDKELGKEIEPNLSPDPFGEMRREAAIEKGKQVYHFTANCYSCHRSYLSLDEYNTVAKSIGEPTIARYDEGAFELKPQDSEYGSKVIPPDFTWHPVRSAKTVRELAIRIGAGINGVMPTWKDIITDEELWAVSYYVEHLMKIKDTPSRSEFVTSLEK